MEYKKTVRQIVSLPWEKLLATDLLQLMVLCAYTAREFAESLRLALLLCPQHQGLATMAEGELSTNNLSFASYNHTDDHAAFLWHFINKGGVLIELPPEISRAGEVYTERVKALKPRIRAMSIFSREKELPHIFRRILEVSPTSWTSHDHQTLAAFKYYLERHIQLDAGEGGHEELLKGLPVTNEVDEFYQIRLQLYQPIFPDFIPE
ncbi:MAG: DUF3050 domain-containing protein [Patescibacteria group bacterium]